MFKESIVINFDETQRDSIWTLGNTQNVRELLLREACRFCQCYATDIIIFINWMDRLIKEKYIGNVFVGFYDMGVHFTKDINNAEGQNFSECRKIYKFELTKNSITFDLVNTYTEIKTTWRL